jgi:hypothetical protein
MSRVNDQNLFAQDVARLLQWLEANGYQVTLGEAWRPDEMQAIYVRTGRSKTMINRHGMRLAIDLNIFKDGEWLTDYESLKVVGEVWRRLSPANVWGGAWKSFKDMLHFERRV